MTTSPINVLMIEDDPGDANLVAEFLADQKKYTFQIDLVHRIQEGLHKLALGGTDVVLLDMRLPDGAGLDVFLKIKEQAPSVPVVLMTGAFQEDKIASEALRMGAQDYLTKGEFDAGRLTHAILYAVERKKVQEKIEELAKIKSDFASMVSHELRTPLTAVHEEIDVVLSGSVGPLAERQSHFLQRACSNINRLIRLVNSVLDYQKLEAGKMEFRMLPCDINAMVRQIVEGFIPVAKKKGLEITAQLQEGLPEVMCDQDSIMQVLVNLMGNAIKFTFRGQIKISTTKGDAWVRVGVQDEGPGIRAEDQAKLFQSFSQITVPHGRNTGGTGLGLAISKKIIEQHRGQIGVESVYGKGATFYVVLPIKERRK